MAVIIIIRPDAREIFRAFDTAKRGLARLNYPPKTPTKGSASRRKEKLRKAGLVR